MTGGEKNSIDKGSGKWKKRGSKGFRGEDRISGCFQMEQQAKWGERQEEEVEGRGGHTRRDRRGSVGCFWGLKGQIRPGERDGEVGLEKVRG